MNVAGKTGGNMQLDSFQGEPHEFRWLKTFYNACPQKVQKLIYLYYEKSLHNRLLSIFLRDVAIERLRKASTKCKSIDDYIALAFSFKLGPFDIKPAQIEWEISRLMQILAKLKPKAALEIGTERGGTFFLLTKVASQDATLMSVDLPRGPLGGWYSKQKIPFYRSFGSANQKIHLLRMDSHNETTLSEVERILCSRKLDFLFIDGDHSYEGVKKDFQMYGKLVKRGGIVAFHDIAVHPLETGCEVNRFWNEIKELYEYIEIIKNLNQTWAGLGVIFKR